MKPDKFKKRYQATPGNARLRHQIALEAARRMYDAIGPREDDASGRLREATEADYYTAKRKAAAVLGHRVRPGDLPSDSEVREQVIALSRSRSGGAAGPAPDNGPEPEGALRAMADHVDRFAIYKMRLQPLESVKQNPRTHPEGDALYHSLQVFERAREVRPFDEEFLLAALLHDAGKAIDPQDPVAALVEALRGAVGVRTLRLIEHHRDPSSSRERPPGALPKEAADDPEFRDDLQLLRELDGAGRVAGAPVGTLDEALAYLRGLEREDYLDP